MTSGLAVKVDTPIAHGVVTVPAPEGFPDAAAVCLRDETLGVAAWAQRDALDPGRILIAVTGLEPGTARRYRIADAGPSRAEQGVEVCDHGTSIQVDVAGERFTRYHYTPAEAPARPFWYPLLAHGGLPVTRSFPMADVEGERRDHPHHRSVWVAHGDVNGADNWSEEPGHARTEHLGFDRIFSGPIAGGFRSRNRWVTSEGQPLLDEVRDFIAYAPQGSIRSFDLTLRFTPTSGDVKFGDTKEGGMIAVRVATSMDAEKDGTIENSEGGTNERETWGKPARWCDYHGPVQGRTVGIALMDHPDNPRHPTYWHVRNYGLMTANPFGLSYYYNDKSRDGSLVLSAGTTTTWRYRLVVHSGTTQEARIAEQYAAFIARAEASAS